MIAKGTVLVPKETPAGPPAAREAWADALGQILVVMDDRAGVMVINCPSEGASYSRSTMDVLGEYEPADAAPEFGRSWAATITRAATEAARVPAEKYDGPESARYWQRIAAVVRTVFREEEAAQAG